ncbi:hypothetical protein NPIL_285781 [Nephila pilipes]|uniref:Uncharacterized protein n=1 Tax=Nephila pilipes TaxID=299642 RepID=A0A8X6Q2N2_NEPPI|nr:hypothetical protein NPIL_285781 [Nephila pilipes]
MATKNSRGKRSSQYQKYETLVTKVQKKNRKTARNSEGSNSVNIPLLFRNQKAVLATSKINIDRNIYIHRIGDHSIINIKRNLRGLTTARHRDTYNKKSKYFSKGSIK